MNRGGIAELTLNNGETYTPETLDQMPQNQRRVVYDWLCDAYIKDIRVRTLINRSRIFKPVKNVPLAKGIELLMDNSGIAEITLGKRKVYTPETLSQMPQNQRRVVYDWLYYAQDNSIDVSTLNER